MGIQGEVRGEIEIPPPPPFGLLLFRFICSPQVGLSGAGRSTAQQTKENNNKHSRQPTLTPAVADCIPTLIHHKKGSFSSMIKNKTLEKLIRFLVTLLGAGLGAGAAAISLVFLKPSYPVFTETLYAPSLLYAGCGLTGAVVFFLIARWFIRHTLTFMTAAERFLEKMSLQQMLFTGAGLVTGLVVAALISWLIMAAGPSLITISFSAITYVVLGTLGIRIGYRRHRDGKTLFPRWRDADSPAGPESIAAAPKLLDTSVIIDGRVTDIVKTGFLEGRLVVPQFVLAELQHLADSGDQQRRLRGRRGLDVLQKLRKEASIVVDETDYPDVSEVDVKLLRLCRDQGGVVVTNDYNLNKVAGVTGIRVLNINDLANAVKPMLLSGEELTVHILREGKEPGQGVAYLDDGTMVVVENGRRHVGETITAVVTTVLQTSAGRMIFTKAA